MEENQSQEPPGSSDVESWQSRDQKRREKNRRRKKKSWWRKTQVGEGILSRGSRPDKAAGSFMGGVDLSRTRGKRMPNPRDIEDKD